MSRQGSHKETRVFLVVVDASPEMRLALRYACRRAQHSGGHVALLYVVEPAEPGPWMALEEMVREERFASAQQILAQWAAQVEVLTGQKPDLYVREGDCQVELLRLIVEEPSISILVLAASNRPNDPGPLVTRLGQMVGQLPIPMTLVPGNLSEAEIDALT
jgi:nucleotide-binding universal stress UspA family protein